MKWGQPSALACGLMLMGFVCLPASAAHAAALPQVRVGVSKATVDSAWRLSETGCENLGKGDTYCDYHAGYVNTALGVGVDFRNGQGATEFDVQFDLDVYAPHGWAPGDPYKTPNPGAAMYGRFLTSLLPSGAKRSTCRSYARLRLDPLEKYTVRAEACLYGYKRTTILVLHCLTRPSNAGWVGQVVLGKGYASLSRPPFATDSTG